MITLRVVGSMRSDEPFATVWGRFAPWMWSGLVVMALTGLVLIIGEPVREFTALSFWLKMSLLVISISSTSDLRAHAAAGSAHVSERRVFGWKESRGARDRRALARDHLPRPRDRLRRRRLGIVVAARLML